MIEGTAVSTADQVDVRMGTRWGRSFAAIGMGLVLLTGAGAAVYSNVLGLNASVTIQNEGVSFATSRLKASDVGLGMTLVKGQDGNRRNALRAGFASATMNGLCISKTETFLGIGAVTIKVTAGDGNNTSDEIVAQNAAFDIIELTTKGNGVELEGSAQIGLATPDITTVPGAAPFSSNPLGQVNSAFTNGTLENYDANIWNANANGGRMNGQGFTGVDATKATITTAYGKVLQAQIVGSIKMPKLKIEVLPGTVESCEAQAIRVGSSNGYFPGIT